MSAVSVDMLRRADKIEGQTLMVRLETRDAPREADGEE